jgi:hypothetical protein
VVLGVAIYNSEPSHHVTTNGKGELMPIVSLPGGQLRDEIRQPQIDTITLVAGDALAGNRRFYTDVQGKSLAKTNMTINGQLPTATSFRVQGLALDAQNSNPVNSSVLPIFLNKSSIRLFIGEKDYWKGAARFAMGRMQEASSAATTVAATTIQGLLQQYGWAAVQPIVLQGRHVVDINPLQTFYVEWQTLASDLTAAENAITIGAGTDAPFVFSLKGLLRRPVQ